MNMGFGQPDISNPLLVKHFCVSFVIFRWSTFTKTSLKQHPLLGVFIFCSQVAWLRAVFCDSTCSPTTCLNQRDLSSHSLLLPWNNAPLYLHIHFQLLRSWPFPCMHSARRKRCYKKTVCHTGIQTCRSMDFRYLLIRKGLYWWEREARNWCLAPGWHKSWRKFQRLF